MSTYRYLESLFVAADIDEDGVLARFEFELILLQLVPDIPEMQMRTMYREGMLLQVQCIAEGHALDAEFIFVTLFLHLGYRSLGIEM